MAVTVESLFVKAMALIDELLPAGTYDPAKVADYKGRTIPLADLCQKELYKVGDLFSSYEISCYPASNMLGDNSNFDVTQFVGDDITYEANGGNVKSYYFEADSNGGTAYIEDYAGTWNVLATISLVNTTNGFMAYSGEVTPTSGATKSRIRFSGTRYYKTVNRALFNIQFETSKIPTYRPWVPVALPTNIKTIDKVIAEYPDKKYSMDNFYKIEWTGNRQYLYLDYYYSGKLRVQYKPIPTTITATTDSVEIDDVTAQMIAYYLASNFMASEQNEYLSSMFKRKYDELKAEAYIKQPLGEIEIIDSYS